jgi:type VI secretion system secreted protein Hcp
VPIYLQLAAQGNNAIAGKGKIFGMSYGSQTMTPRNVSKVAFQMEGERDLSTGMPTGKRTHKPFTITKETDPASPSLFAALKGQDVIPRLEIHFTHASHNGQRLGSFVLSNASLAGYQRKHQPSKVPSAVSSKVSNNTNELEEFQFTFQKIEWTWNPGAISASDDWTT